MSRPYHQTGIVNKVFHKIAEFGNSYGAKAALEASVRYLAVDLGDKNIRVNSISAGPMRTLAGAVIGNARHTFKFTTKSSPLGRPVNLEELGNTALYLLSDLSSAVTGENHHVDCGFSIIGMPRKDAFDEIMGD